MRCFAFVLIALCFTGCARERRALVFQSDFGMKDGAVAAMKGVAVSVSPELRMYDLTHEIRAFDISEAAYRLQQSAGYWPSGTVFVSIVDPGVGSTRKSIVARTKTGHFFVTPDNGTLTLIAESMGIDEVREIDESRNRLRGSNESYTFHGRDVYAYTGARLAAGVITFEEVGPVLHESIVLLPGLPPSRHDNGLMGSIPVLDVQYGNVWTNIDKDALSSIGVAPGDSVSIRISFKDEVRYDGRVYFGHTFADVAEGEELAYFNSLLRLSVAINQGNFASRYGVGSGDDWRIFVSK